MNRSKLKKPSPLKMKEKQVRAPSPDSPRLFSIQSDINTELDEIRQIVKNMAIMYQEIVAINKMTAEQLKEIVNVLSLSSKTTSERLNAESFIMYSKIDKLTRCLGVKEVRKENEKKEDFVFKRKIEEILPTEVRSKERQSSVPTPRRAGSRLCKTDSFIPVPKRSQSVFAKRVS